MAPFGHFFMQYNIPIDRCFTSCVHLSVDAQVAPCPDYCKQCCSECWGTGVFLNYGFLAGMCPVGLLGTCGSSILEFPFYRTFILFSVVVISAYIPTNSKRGFPFIHTPSPVLFVDCLMMAIPTGVEITL